MDILLIGSGVAGLTSALRLLEAKNRVTIWARERAAHTTSSVAAAVWYPYAVAATNALAWGNTSYHLYHDLAKNTPTSGVVLRELIYLERQPTADPAWKDEVGGRDARPDELPPGYTAGLVFNAPVIDMSLYLTYLEAQVLAQGGRIVERAIASWDDVYDGWDAAFDASDAAPRVIVNCAGLAARALVAEDRNDSSDGQGVRPSRGQVVRIERDIMGETKRPGKRESGRESASFTLALIDESDVERPTYIVPRIHDIVLGGTNQLGKELRAVDLAVRDDILIRCAHLALHYDQRFAMSLAALVGGAVAEQFRAWVSAEVAATPAARLRPGGQGDDCGLRPVRGEVCLKRQTLGPGRYVIHNYGHGGAGVTLAWGCADEVVMLAAGVANGEAR